MQRRTFLQSASAAGLLGLAGTAHAQTRRVVRLGQSASLSGGQSRFGRDIRAGVMAAVLAANRREGGQGLQFELATLDDGGVRERSVENTRRLIDEGAGALIGYTSDAAAEACLGLVEQHQMALIGTASGSLGLQGRASACTAQVRAGIDAEFRSMAGYARSFGLRRIAHVHLADSPAALPAALDEALRAVDLRPALVLAVDRNAASVTPAVHKLLGAGLDAVVFSTNAAPALAIVQQMHAAQFRGLHFATSVAGQDLIDGIAAAGRSVVMSLVVPRPNALGLGVVQQCRQDLAALGGSATLGITTLEGYIAGRVAVEAARQAARGGTPGRARIREALATLRTDLGGYRVSFAPNERQGSQHVDLVVIDRHGRLQA